MGLEHVVGINSDGKRMRKKSSKTARRPIRVALVVPPWHSVVMDSMGPVVLKNYLEAHGVGTDIHYLNLSLARRVGLESYHDAAYTMAGEALFAPFLPGGSAGKRTVAVPEAYRWVESAPDFARTCRRMAEQIPTYLDDCLRDVDWGRYGVIGFTVWSTYTVPALVLSSRIKGKFPQARVVFGGPGVASPVGPRLLREFPWLDAVVQGDGEEPLLEWVSRPSAPRPVAGVWERVGGKIFPPPAPARPVGLKELPAALLRDDYVKGLKKSGLGAFVDPIFQLEGGRGCWYGQHTQCAFCGIDRDAIAYRRRSADSVWKEMRGLMRKYGVRKFRFTDNNISPAHIVQLLPRLRGLKDRPQVFWCMKVTKQKEHIRSMASAGVRFVQIGIENMSRRILDMMQKGTTPLDNAQVLKWCRESGPVALWNFLYGVPGELPEDYRESLRWLGRLSHCQPPTVHPIRLERFSPFFERARRYRLRRLRPDPIYRVLYPGRSDREGLAFFFDADFPGKSERDRRSAPLRRFCEAWRRCFPTKVFCRVERRPGGLRIRDQRLWPTAKGPRLKRKTHRLDGWKADLYSFCDGARSFVELRRWAEARGVPQKQLSAALADMKKREIIVDEEGRWLALAVDETLRLPVPADPGTARLFSETARPAVHP